MDQRRTHQAAILIMVVLAVVCSVTAQKPQPPAPGPPKPADCNSATTKPSPVQQSYVFQTCIVAKFGAYFAATEGNMTKFVELKNGVVNNATSQCGANSTNAKLVVEFTCASLEFEFQHEINNTFISVKAINGNYQLDDTNNTFANSTPMFKTNQEHYYKCNTEQSIAADKSSTKLVLSNVAFEAFRGNTTGTDFFKMPEECPLDSTGASDLVRIGVGISLVLLAALVLVAYFVGRRRWAERSSYESV